MAWLPSSHVFRVGRVGWVTHSQINVTLSPSWGTEGHLGHFGRVSVHLTVALEWICLSGVVMGQEQGLGAKMGADGPGLGAQLGGLLAEQFWVSVTCASPSGTAGKPFVPSLSAPAATSSGLGAVSHGTPSWSPGLRNSSSSKRALFVKMKPVCASVPVSRLACPAALS